MNAYPIPAATTTPPQMAKIVAPINPVLTNPVRVAISRAKVLISPDATTMIIQPTLQPTTQREVLQPRVQIRTTTNPVSKTWADTNSAVHISSVPTTATSAATTAISSVPPGRISAASGYPGRISATIKQRLSAASRWIPAAPGWPRRISAAFKQRLSATSGWLPTAPGRLPAASGRIPAAPGRLPAASQPTDAGPGRHVPRTWQELHSAPQTH